MKPAARGLVRRGEDDPAERGEIALLGLEGCDRTQLPPMPFGHRQ